MPKNTDPIEAHILFCPQDVGAQLKAAEYIADVMPTHLFVCGVDNMIMPAHTLHDRQAFYNEVTGARQASGTKPLSTVIPELGMKVMLYGSRHEVVAEERGRDAVAKKAINESSKAGRDAQEVYPYFQLIMHLEGSEIPVISQPLNSDRDAMHPIYRATNEVYDAADIFLGTQNGLEEFEMAILEYRDAVRNLSLDVKKNLVRAIKKLPSTHPMGRVAMLLDNPALLSISQEAPFSRKVDATINVFETLVQIPKVYPDETSMVFFRGNMDFGLQFPSNDPRQQEFEKRSFGYMLMDAIMEKIGMDKDAGKCDDYYGIASGIDLSAKSAVFYEQLKDLAFQVAATYGSLDITSPRYDERKSELDQDFVIKLGSTLSSLR